MARAVLSTVQFSDHTIQWSTSVLMRDFRLVPTQSRRLLKVRDGARPRLWTFDRVLEVSKIIAILVAGLWTIFLYFSGQRQRSSLELEQAKLQTVRSELEIQKTKLESKAFQEKRDVSQAGAFLFDATIRLNKKENSKDGPHSATLDYQLKNSGEVPITVKHVIIEWYAGKVLSTTEGHGIIIANDVPVGVLQLEDDPKKKTIQWKMSGWHGCSYQGARLPSHIPSKYELKSDGCGTDVYPPGIATTQNSYVFLSKKEKPDFVGATIYVGLSTGRYIWKSVSDCVSCE